MTNKTVLLFFIAFLFFTVSVGAQKPEIAIRCVYVEEYVKDADKPQERRQDEFNLDMRGGQSAFYSVYERAVAQERDSLMKLGLSANEIINRQHDMPRTHQYFEIYKNASQKGKYICYDKVVKLYRYTDNLPLLKWTIASETKEIVGYKCQKAIATLYGREWTAWFTPKVPVADGPWLLTGLPGLVLEVTDSEAVFHFKAIELKQIPAEVSVLPRERKAISCTRDEFLKYRAKYYGDMQAGLQNITGRKLQIMGADGKPTKGKKKNLNFFEK